MYIKTKKEINDIINGFHKANMFKTTEYINGDRLRDFESMPDHAKFMIDFNGQELEVLNINCETIIRYY